MMSQRSTIYVGGEICRLFGCSSLKSLNVWNSGTKGYHNLKKLIIVLILLSMQTRAKMA